MTVTELPPTTTYCRLCALGYARTDRSTAGIRPGYELVPCETRRGWFHVARKAAA